MLKLASQCVLVPSGLMLIGAGGMMLFAPDLLHAKNGVTLGDNPSLLSEIRAPGGFLTLAGFGAIACTFLTCLRLPALALIAMIYGSFGVARLYSMAVDGRPADPLVAVTALELIVGLLAATLVLTAFLRSRATV